MFTFLDKRISFWQQRRFGQCREDDKNKQAEEEKHGADFRNPDKPPVANRRRHDHVKEINIMSEQNYGARHGKHPGNSFKIGVDQN